MIALDNSYVLKIAFNGTPMDLNPSTLKEFFIQEDINQLLPSFKLRFKDTQGAFTHLLPVDKSLNQFSVQLGVGTNLGDDSNSYEFNVFREFPLSETGVATDMELSGLLDIDQVFAPCQSRGWSTTQISAIITQIADEMGIDNTDISPSLNYIKLIIQPNVPNNKFLKRLERELVGSNGETGFKIFVKQVGGQPTLVCRSIPELIKQNVKYKYSVTEKFDNSQPGFDPLYDYDIVNNYKVLGIFGGKYQDYSYFDWYNTKLVEGSLELTDFYSLTNNFLVDSDDSDDSVHIDDIGDTNDFTQDFQGVIGGNYTNRINDFIKMWGWSVGNSQISPGDIILVLFQHGANTGDVFAYQHSGYWMVERVCRHISDSYRTRLLLTRNGVDTDKSTTLIAATQKKK